MLKKLDISKNRKLTLLYLILFFSVFAVIMALCPYSVDDAYYNYLNITDFHKMLHFSAGYGNGRVLGNLLAVILCKSVFLASVFRALVATLIVYFISKLVCSDSEKLLTTILISGTLTLGMCGLMFGEVFSWISGFSNYSPPILAMLISLYCIKSYEKGGKYNILLIIVVLLSSSAAQLFTENCTINNMLLACLVLLYSVIKRNGKQLISFTNTIASGIGAFVMLYARLFVKDKDGIYETVNYDAHVNSLSDTLQNILFNLKKLTSYISKLEILLLVLSVTALVVLFKANIKNNAINKLKPAIAFMLVLFPAYSFFASYCFKDLNSFNYKLGMLYMLVSLILFVLYIASIISVGVMLEREQSLVAIFCTIFAVFTAGYMLLLNPINIRAFYYSYILLLITALVMLQRALDLISINKRAVTSTLAVCNIAIVLLLIPLHISIYTMDKKVNEYIDYQIEQGNDTVVICNLTDSDYFHHSYSIDRLGYTYYRNRPQDVEFKNTTITDWVKNYYKNGNYKTAE